MFARVDSLQIFIHTSSVSLYHSACGWGLLGAHGVYTWVLVPRASPALFSLISPFSSTAVSSHISSDFPEMSYSNRERTPCSSPPPLKAAQLMHILSMSCVLCQINISLPLKWVWGTYVYVCVGVWVWTAAFLLHPCELSTHFLKPIFHRLGVKKKKEKKILSTPFSWVNFISPWRIGIL